MGQWELDFSNANTELKKDIALFVERADFKPETIIQEAKEMSLKFRDASPIFDVEALVSLDVTDRIDKLDFGQLILTNLEKCAHKISPPASLNTSCLRYKAASALHEVLINDK